MYSDQWEGELVQWWRGCNRERKKWEEKWQERGFGLKNWNKGVTGGPLNWRMSIKDDYLGGSDAGYDLDVFRDHAGVSGSRGIIKTIADDPKEENSTGEESELMDHANFEGSPLRTGTSMRLQLPTTMAKFHYQEDFNV